MSRTNGNWTTIRERLFSPVGLHAIGFGILAVATLVLGIRVFLDWRATSASSEDALTGRQATLKLMQIQTAPLRGLDKKVELSRQQIAEFYAKRIPPSDSSILEQLGDVMKKGSVKMTRAGYTQAPGSGDLTEIRIDAGVSGDYPGIMKVINGIERCPAFFVIRAMQLTGQQSGQVNLRLQVSTWMRPEDVPKDMPFADKPDARDTAPATAPAGEGR